MVEVGPMPYPVMNTILDDGFPAGSLNYWLSSFTQGLPDGLIDTMVERFASVPSPMTAILLEHFHGAVTRVGVTDTAVPHRDGGLEPPHPLRVDGSRRDGREHRVDARDAQRPSARISTRPGGSTTSATTRAVTPCGPRTGRTTSGCSTLKRRYDPENVFHHNHNIDPN